MKRRSTIRCAWFRRAISYCRGHLWRGCIILSSALAAFLAVSWFVLDWTDEGAETYPGGVILRDASGDILRVTLGPGDIDCRPGYVAESDDWIVKAVVASEDGAFWSHRGVRPLSVLRAACQNIFYGRRISGASTISMQTVRLIRPHPKSLWWKFKEALLALKMERVRDKRWILSQYLNRAPFGSNLVGIESAASGWFGKSARELGLGEAAMLAGMVQAPSRYRPDRNLDQALRRRDYVLGRMLAMGVITQDQLAAAQSVIPVVCRAPRPFRCPHFCDWVMGTCPRGDVVTSLDADVQSSVEQAVNAAAERGGYAVSAVVRRVDTGDVVALACSGDYFDAASGQVNTALAPRPAGSTLKPFLSALALDLGYIAPSETLLDAPVSFKGYRPANFDATYRGDVSLRDALILSLNVPFVRLLDRVGVERFGTHLRELGFAHMGDSDGTFGLGMAIGNVEVSLLELSHAYATLASRAKTDGGCYLVTDMLSGAERSGAALGHVADVRTSRFAWKTGTSSAYRDAWAVLWNPQYVVGVWCGHKSGGFGDRSLVGAKASAPVAWQIARTLYPQDDGPWFAEPRDFGDWTRRCEATARRRRAETTQLAIVRPENEARFGVVPGMPRQKVVCQVVGNAAGSCLWWFVDNRPVGTTRGAEPFVYDLDATLGRHTISCSTADAVSAEVTLLVEE